MVVVKEQEEQVGLGVCGERETEQEEEQDLLEVRRWGVFDSWRWGLLTLMEVGAF